MVMWFAHESWSLLWLVMFQEFMDISVEQQENQQPLKMYCVNNITGYMMQHANWSTYYIYCQLHLRVDARQKNMF